MVYRGVKCGLMDVWDGANKARGTMGYSLELVKELAQFDPNSDHVCWVGRKLRQASYVTHLSSSLMSRTLNWGRFAGHSLKKLKRYLIAMG
jgi:hypothetical protein